MPDPLYQELNQKALPAQTELSNKIYAIIDEIPTIPTMIPKILGLMQSHRSDAADIAAAISADPALTSKILKVANSAYYGFSKKIANLQKAVSLLGFNMVKSLALSLGVMRNLPATSKCCDFSQEGLWLHSLAVATLMQEMAKRFGKRGPKEDYFVVGLLHDIGKVVFDQFFPEPFQKALEEAHNLPANGLHICERRLIGLDHGEVGGMLLARWRFPDSISRSIDLHHQASIPPAVNGRAIAMLRTANALAQELGLGKEGNPVPPPIPEEDLQLVGIGAKQIDDLKTYLLDLQEGLHSFLSAFR